MDQNNKHSRFNNPQAIAWAVVLFSFVVFCILCAAGTFGAYWFFFESPTPLNASLTVSRGTVTIILPDGTSSVIDNTSDKPQSIPPKAILQTVGNLSQGYITFEDNRTRQNVGTVFLLPDSSLRLISASRPNFEWSKREYALLFDGLSGHFAIDIPTGLSRSLALNMQAAAGAVQFNTSGLYQVDALDQSLKLYTMSGQGLLVSTARGWAVDTAYQGTLDRTTSEALVEPYSFEDLIVQNIRSGESPATTTNSLGSGDIKDKLPLGWGCVNQAVDPNEPEGTWERATLDGRTVLHMVRGNPTSKLVGHAETSCEFYFKKDTVGQDVSLYKSLSIQLMMKILYQDVTTCGIQGSECPVMLEIEYLPADSDDGKTQFWRQGFYAVRPPEDTSIRTCNTCPHDHEQISANAWYIYDSGDLLKQFPEGKKPVSIVKVRVYSSGHQFDIALAEVSVLGEK